MRRLNRREILKFGLGASMAVSLAGCTTSQDSSDNPNTPTVLGTLGDTSKEGSLNTLTDTATTTPTDTATTTPTDTATTTPTTDVDPGVSTKGVGSASNAGPVAPDARFVVAKDGTGDYESYDSVKRVAKKGDVVKFKKGEYTITVSTELGAIVGSGANNTTLSIDGKVPPLYDASISNLPGQTEKTEPSQNQSLDQQWVRCDVHSPIKREMDLKAFYCRFRASLIPESGVGYFGIIATGCEFDGPVETIRAEFDRCIFNGPYTPTSYHSYADETKFLKGVTVGDVNDIKLRKCNIAGIKGGPETTKYYPRIVDSIITTRNSNYAYNASGISVYRSTIKGPITMSGSQKMIGNVFDAEAEVTQYIDGHGPSQLFWNAFINGDIRLDSGTKSVYHKGFGNYYSTFEGNDEDNDGVLDLPRPIPGEAKLTDQYPLAQSDLSTYNRYIAGGHI